MDRAYDPISDTVKSDRVSLGWLAVLAGCLVLLVPLLVAPIPPLGDYPNHLARMWLLSSDAAQASMAQFYQVRFDTFTNVAIDLIAATVGRMTGWMFAGQLSVALAIVLPPLGGMLLWRSIFRGTHWWMLSFGLFAFGALMLNGFLNFQISVGLALLLAALEPVITARGIGTQVSARAVAGGILLVVHPFGLLFYVLLLTALTVGPRWDRRAWRPAILRLLPAAAAILGIVLLFVALVPSLPGAQENSGLHTLGAEVFHGLSESLKAPKHKLVKLFLAVRAYSNPLDVLTLLACVAPLAWAAWQRQLRVHAGLAVLCILLVVAYAVCPDYILGASWVDTRFSVMLAFAAAAACLPQLSRRAATISATVLLLLLLGRTGYIATLWHARQADVAAVAEALEAVPAGSSVIPFELRPVEGVREPAGRHNALGESNFRHLPALAVPWRHAFVPILFTARGKQPVVVTPQWDALSEPNGGTLNDVHVLDPEPPPEADAKWARYSEQWRRFDYMLLINADVSDKYGPVELPKSISLVKDAGFAKLYKIAH